MKRAIKGKRDRDSESSESEDKEGGPPMVRLERRARRLKARLREARARVAAANAAVKEAKKEAEEAAGRRIISPLLRRGNNVRELLGNAIAFPEKGDFLLRNGTGNQLRTYNASGPRGPGSFPLALDGLFHDKGMKQRDREKILPGEQSGTPEQSRWRTKQSWRSFLGGIFTFPQERKVGVPKPPPGLN